MIMCDLFQECKVGSTYESQCNILYSNNKDKDHMFILINIEKTFGKIKYLNKNKNKQTNQDYKGAPSS